MVWVGMEICVVIGILRINDTDNPTFIADDSDELLPIGISSLDKQGASQIRRVLPPAGQPVRPVRIELIERSQKLYDFIVVFVVVWI